MRQHAAGVAHGGSAWPPAVVRRSPGSDDHGHSVSDLNLAINHRHTAYTAASSARHLIPPQSKTAKRPASSMCTHPRMPRDAAHLPARNRVPTLDTSHDRCHPLCMCDRAGTHLTVPSGNAEVFHTSPSQLAMRRVHNTTQRPAAGSAIGAHYLFHVDHPVHRRALFGPRLRSTRLHQQQLASTLCHRLRGQGSNRHSLPPRPHSDALSAAGGVSVVQER